MGIKSRKSFHLARGAVKRIKQDFQPQALEIPRTTFQYGDFRYDYRYAMKRLRNTDPGEVLLEEFVKPMNLSQNALGRAIGVPPRRINEIVLGKGGITADTAIRLPKHFGTSEPFWMGMQADYDLEEARRGRKLVA